VNRRTEVNLEGKDILFGHLIAYVINKKLVALSHYIFDDNVTVNTYLIEWNDKGTNGSRLSSC